MKKNYIIEDDESGKALREKIYGDGYQDGHKDGYDKGYDDAQANNNRPHGEWIPNDKISPWGNPGRACSLCGKIVEFSENFCPKCGADMRGGAE